MCANYRPSRRELIAARYQVQLDVEPKEAWPLSLAPIIRQYEGHRVVEMAQFGLLPHFAKSRQFGRATYNARSETVAEKASFKVSWKKAHFCLIPAGMIMEPCYESGRAVRWEISPKEDEDWAIAGIWSWWKDPETGQGMPSFAMLTLNADQHPLMQRFHKPEDEKRMVYIVDPGDYDTWLSATPDLARAMIAAYPAEKMQARVSASKANVTSPKATGDVF
ncbi:SOS response-associated peptidase [Parachitinimonas caeni]|uniref:Abasic site processing protein n=1 Tax=Parachitinimonas caeni TaxID=3031301 RepID=A0ABT7E385_9NEIS|nr:SOS response-associated peptidase family protein [Parachitinimonas caeni]MDK2126504.1 SOS response-associated peptidase family protein [Parachitinimonas caeni]